MATANHTDTAASLRLSVVRLARLLRQQDGSTLTPSMASAVAMINLHGPITLGDLAAREHVSKPTMTRIVEKLTAMELVERRACETDGRVAFAVLTPAGKKLIRNARQRRTQWLMEQLDDLSPDEWNALHTAAEILERVVARAGEGER